MKQKQHLINTFQGFKIELYLLIGSIITSYGYSWLNHTKIHDQFIVTMLRVFILFADLGVFLAIGYMIDFKRGVAVGYIYKILAFLSLDEKQSSSQYEFITKVVVTSFGLIVYYKLTLLIIVYTASYLIKIDYEDEIAQKKKHQTSIKRQQQEQRERLFSKQEQQLLSNQEQHSTKEDENSEIQRTINRIKLSLRYHKEDEFYKKLEIFYFIFYNSTCIMVLFPFQQYVVDFVKAIHLGLDSLQFLQNVGSLQKVNNKVSWLINFHTITNVIFFWLIIMFGQFKINSKYPQLTKSYMLSVLVKFFIIQLISLCMLLGILASTPITQQSTELSLLKIINIQQFTVAYIIHNLIPLLISFLLLRLYLGQSYYMNKLVSLKFNFHKGQDDSSNLDEIIYEGMHQNDIVKVRHFVLTQDQLIPRHKLKRYSEEQRLKHFVNEENSPGQGDNKKSLIVEIQQLFGDFMVLQLYNKLSRWIAVWIFYITLFVFLLSMNINDTVLTSQDAFFNNIPPLLLVFGTFIIHKFESSPNIFYPRVILWFVKKFSEFLSSRKAYNFIRLVHFYSIIFSIWVYRILSQAFLPTHHSVEQKVKLTLYEYYSSQKIAHNPIMISLLQGWAQYFTTHSASCDYGTTCLVVDSSMIFLITLSVLMQRKYTNQKYNQNWNPLLMLLKVITPIYAFYVWVGNMECLQWSRVIFCVCLCVGVMIMNANWKQVQSGIVRNEQGQYEVD